MRALSASRISCSIKAFCALLLAACGGQTDGSSDSPKGTGGATSSERLQGGAPTSGSPPILTGGVTSAGGWSASGGATNGGEAPAAGGLVAVGGITVTGGRAVSSGGGSATGGAPASGGLSAIGGRDCYDWEGWTRAAERVPVLLEFLIDASSSMAEDAYPADAIRNASKWEELARVLPQVLATFPAEYAVGASFFNYDLSSGCHTRSAVPISPLDAAQLARFGSAFAGQSPGGLRPTAAGWQFALSELASWSPPAGYEYASRFIVLITDGSPNVAADCSPSEGTPLAPSDYEAWISAVRDEGQAAGVGTFVVGLSGSEDPGQASYDPLYLLSRLAVAGGTAPPGCTPSSGSLTNSGLNPRGTYCHLDTSDAPDFGLALEQALADMQAAAIPCSYVLSDSPFCDYPDRNLQWVWVDLTPSDAGVRTLPRSPDSSCVGGHYYWLAPASAGSCPAAATLCPSACGWVKADPGARVQFVVICPNEW